MYSLFLSVHILACLLLIVSVLMQSGKSGGFQGIFGSSGEVIFSTPSGSSFLRKITMVLAAVFGLTSLALTVMTKQRMYRSVVFEQPVQAPPSAPAEAPTAPPAEPPQPPK